MRYKGATLVLDNFREVLKGYSVDVQDVVRSALLDGVSIEKYLDSCKNNPYRLDQIRLGMKEGIDESYFRYTSGEIIRGIRGLLNQGVDLSQLKKYKPGSLSDKCFLYLIYWCKDGYNVSNLNLAIIPDYLLEFFDYGVRKNIDMSVFNNGTQYPMVFTDCCIRIMENGCSVNKYAKGTWGLNVLKKMEKISSLKQKTRYNSVYSVIRPEDSESRVALYEKLTAYGVDLKQISGYKNNKPMYSDEAMGVIVKGFENNVNLLSEMINGKSVDDLSEILAERVLSRGRVLSGSLRGKDNKNH